MNEADDSRQPLDVQSLQQSVRANQLIHQVEVVSLATSTNDLCHDRAVTEHHGTVIFAEEQSAGRGQHGRAWSAPRHSALLFSLLIKPDASLDTPRFLTSWSAVAVAQTLEEHYFLTPALKWPNDVYVQNRKICGILVERRRGTVVGIGVNVSISEEEFPTDLRAPATSISLETGMSIDRTQLAIRLIRQLETLYQQALAEGPDFLYSQWETFSVMRPGAKVELESAGQLRTGRLLRLRPDIGATVMTADGNTVNFKPEQLGQIRFHEED